MKHNYLFFILIIFGLSSCVSHEELINFNQGTPLENSQNIPSVSPLLIQSDDLLSIRVLALDERAAAPYNVDPINQNMANLGGGVGTPRPLLGYLVDHEGNINFPQLGTIKISGLSTQEVRNLLINKLSQYLQNPEVIVRYLNFRVTILGEANTPGTFFFSNERITILDALGQAGDLTPYANRTNILLIREQNGERIYQRINLQQSDVFQLPYFYLKQNDVIYIEPLSEKTAIVRDQTQRLLPWVSIITGLITLTLTLTNL